MKPTWLTRRTVEAPYMTLCLSEAAYLTAVKHCGIKNPDAWLGEHARASVHTWVQNSNLLCLVCVHPDAAKADPIDLCSSLVHEAVHVFQRLCEHIGERKPSMEFEAYSIQNISEALMREYVRQTQPIDKRKK